MSPELMTSANWEAAATGMRNTKYGAIALGGLVAAAGSSDPRTARIGALGAAVFGVLGQLAGDMEQKFRENAQRAREEEQKAEVARQAAAQQEKNRREEEERRQAAEKQQAERFSQRLDDARDRHQERVRSGEFIKEYQDTPIRERDYSNVG